MKPRQRYSSIVLVLIAVAIWQSGSSISASDLLNAQKLLLTGNYEEAAEVFAPLVAKDPLAALGLARTHSAQGEYDKAVKELTAAVAKFPKAAALPAELALLAMQRGDYETAQQQADAALALNPNQPVARWVTAELHRLHGRLEKAEAAYEWFVDYYNDTDEITDAETLYYVGLGAAQFARWTNNSGQFRFLVNKLYPEVLKLEPNYWPAKLASAELFIEKYNEADATTELNAALKLNSSAAEIHAARAELAIQNYNIAEAESYLKRAFEVNPNLLLAWQLQADAKLANFNTAEAMKLLEEAKKLNPRSEETLGRLAAAYGFADGLNHADEKLKSSRMQQIIDEAAQHNPQCGQFFETLGETFDLLRKYPAAAKYFAEAHRRMPQLSGSVANLGLMQMRLGEEAAAKKLLEQAFEADPFHVRVKNMLEVLDVLDNYAVIETEHFIIKFDRGQDEILATYAAKYLEEEVYADLVKKLGYEPAGKSLFEIFNRAKNTGGHGWFSARMVGLPYIGTVGACAGKMVAMASPDAMPEKFNWARVLRHEFVHVVNLQQTDFNIPHWFTEALAVQNEGYPPPTEWTQLLARRHAEGTLFNLDNINHGFLRPGAGDDWTLAYCQAELYAEYMLLRFGDDSLAKMLAAYAANLGTRAAIEKSFGISQEEFEKGYDAHVQQVVAGVAAAEAKQRTLRELEQAIKTEPENAQLLADLANVYLMRKNNADARKFALAALKLDKQQQLAAYVLARLYLSIGDNEVALEKLESSFQQEKPQENHLALLAGLKQKAEATAEAETLLKLGAQHFPHDDRWPKLLAALYIKSGDDDKLRPILERLSDLDTDNAPYRKKLAELAASRKDFPAQLKWSTEVLYVDVNDASAHALRGEALFELEKFADAAQEFEFALRINSSLHELRLKLAEAYAKAGDKKKSREAAEELLRRQPDHKEAEAFLEKLD